MLWPSNYDNWKAGVHLDDDTEDPEVEDMPDATTPEVQIVMRESEYLAMVERIAEAKAEAARLRVLLDGSEFFRGLAEKRAAAAEKLLDGRYDDGQGKL